MAGVGGVKFAVWTARVILSAFERPASFLQRIGRGRKRAFQQTASSPAVTVKGTCGALDSVLVLRQAALIQVDGKIQAAAPACVRVPLVGIQLPHALVGRQVELQRLPRWTQNGKVTENATARAVK